MKSVMTHTLNPLENLGYGFSKYQPHYIPRHMDQLLHVCLGDKDIGFKHGYDRCTFTTRPKYQRKN